MGCCESSEQDDFYEPTERDGLLASGHGANDRDGVPHNSNSSGRGQQKPDEQSALTRILQQTSNNLIDISAQALSTDVSEETEAQFRSKQYGTRINHVRIASAVKLGSGRANPFTVLSQPSVPQSDIDLAVQAAQKTPQCMSHIVIRHKEDLVVPFGVP